MANTPLYKRMKKNAQSFYAFPGAGEDISAAYQNENYRMYFSKFVLLNLPKQQLLSTEKKYFDFEEAFITSNSANPTIGYADQMIESLRNYVANHEVTIKDSRLNGSEYYYDNSALKTTSEKIFWKWCKKLGLMEFMAANPTEDFFSNLPEFETNNINDTSYLPEVLWKERQVLEVPVLNMYQTAVQDGTKLEIVLNSKSDIRVGDKIMITGETTDFTAYGTIYDPQNNPILDLNNVIMDIIYVYEGTDGNTRIITNNATTLNSAPNVYTGEVVLLYQKLVQYVGEIHGTNNVQDSNEAFTSVYAHIPAHTGQTPTVLFKTEVDENYKPNMTFPIIPSQNQAEVVGAEVFSNPLVSSPQNYPGGYYAQFDNDYYQYVTNSGDEIRRNGDYYGVSGDINNIVYTPETIDGLVIDFDTEHYAKMNVVGRNLFAFEQFNSLGENGNPPKDFEYNAVLWYYTVEDNNGNSADNLYGITFVNHPENNEKESEYGIRVPALKKLVANDNQDGISYSYSLNLSFRIDNENPQDTYNPESINSLFGFHHYNEAMTKLSETNDRFLNIFTQFSGMKQEIDGLKQLVYTSSNLNTINAKIAKMDKLLTLYSTNQLVSSETIEVVTNRQVSPPEIQLTNIDYTFGEITNIYTKNMYNGSSATPFSINVPINKTSLVNVVNNDNSVSSISNGSNLILVINNDLTFKQSLTIRVRANEESTTNKRLDVYIKSSLDSNSGESIETLLVRDLDLPVAYNTDSNSLNSSMRLDKLNINIDDSAVDMITLLSGGLAKIKIRGNNTILSKTVKVGDVIVINDFEIIDNGTSITFSGQYTVSGIENGYIFIDITTNETLDAYSTSNNVTLPYNLTDVMSTYPTFGLNKGYDIIITRVSEDGLDSREYSNLYYNGLYYNVSLVRI